MLLQTAFFFALVFLAFGKGKRLLVVGCRLPVIGYRLFVRLCYTTYRQQPTINNQNNAFQ